MDFARRRGNLVAHMLRELSLESEQHPRTGRCSARPTPAAPASAASSATTTLGRRDPRLRVQLQPHLLTAPMRRSRRSPASPPPATVLSISSTSSAAPRCTSPTSPRFARAPAVQVDNFLPYAMIGVAAGRADISRSATVIGNRDRPQHDPPIVTPFFFTESETQERRLHLRLVARRRPRHHGDAERVLARANTNTWRSRRSGKSRPTSAPAASASASSSEADE